MKEHTRSSLKALRRSNVPRVIERQTLPISRSRYLRQHSSYNEISSPRVAVRQIACDSLHGALHVDFRSIESNSLGAVVRDFDLNRSKATYEAM